MGGRIGGRVSSGGGVPAAEASHPTLSIYRKLLSSDWENKMLYLSRGITLNTCAGPAALRFPYSLLEFFSIYSGLSCQPTGLGLNNADDNRNHKFGL